MASIYLIRHAQASFGADNYDRLSDLGRSQARALGDYLLQCGIQFDAIYSGDLQRQRLTAEIAAGRLPGDRPVHLDARFNEVQSDEHIEFLMPHVVLSDHRAAALMEAGLSSSKDYQKAIEAVFRFWVSPQSEPLCRESGIQSWADFSAAARSALSEVMQAQGSGRTIGIFSSGGTIATLVAQVLGLDGERTYQFFEPAINCAVTRLLYTGDRVSLAYFNDHSFLDLLGRQKGANLVTFR